MFDLPPVNLQALIAIVMFIFALAVARIVVNIQSGRWPGGSTAVLLFRVLLGFLLTGAIYLGWYAFAGIDVLNR